MSKPADAVAEAAAILEKATRTGVPCAPVCSLLHEADIEAAYAVQRLHVERGIAAGRRLAGRKIGLTSPTVQRQLGVDRPDFGALFADMAVPEGRPIAPGRLLQPKVEAEVALVLGTDLPHGDPTVADLLRATAFALPALEIVDSRIADWGITVADNASCGLYVLGGTPVSLDRVDLRTVTMTLAKNGETVSEGTGADCLGSPLTAALWLASTLAGLGDPLRAGDIVLTGALGPMAVAAEGDEFAAHIEGLGTVTVTFASAATEGAAA
ncbi:fumarylacetoacetate hydrolase family protein [Streptomyces hydrogenans]|uniref:fumarylacetoacetate hydrolase family protein n=1 Tax=Streptomyces hydrogenans TaxID=1873719 RepID=UPI0035DE2D0F